LLSSLNQQLKVLGDGGKAQLSAAQSQLKQSNSRKKIQAVNPLSGSGNTTSGHSKENSYN